MKKIITTGQKASSRRQLIIIDFQNEMVEKYVARKDVEEGVKKGEREVVHQMGFW